MDEVVHNRGSRLLRGTTRHRALPYELLDNPAQYLGSTYLGRRTAGYQAALGCRFRCTFCGVAAMFRGRTALPPAERLEQDLAFLRDELGVDAIQFYDHNFFDREVDMEPLLEVLAQVRACRGGVSRDPTRWSISPDAHGRSSGRADCKMAYIGAESPNDACCTTCARARARIRRSRWWRNAVTATA